jgi:hypothetical protein
VALHQSSSRAATGSFAGRTSQGSFAGTTSQGLPISFTVTSGLVDSIMFRWRAVCADGQRHTNMILLGSAPLSGGSFATSGTLDTGAWSSISGKIRGDSASGVLSRSGPSAFGTDCTANGVTWQAHRTGSGASAGGFAGTTSQGLPISFTVTSGLVDSIMFSWRAVCADGQRHTNTIVLGSAPLAGGSFATSATLDTGAWSSISGKIQGGTASGVLSRSGPSAFGTDCTANGVTWQAHRTASSPSGPEPVPLVAKPASA